jgi:hypothetical protein
VPVTAPPTTNPTVAEQATVAQDQSTVNGDQALVQEDSAQVQQLTTQYQDEQAALTTEEAEAQGAVQQLENSGRDNAQGSAAVNSQYGAQTQADESQLAATNTALSQANAKYQQDEATLATAQTALQVAQDVLASQQG